MAPKRKKQAVLRLTPPPLLERTHEQTPHDSRFPLAREIHRLLAIQSIVSMEMCMWPQFAITTFCELNSLAIKMGTM